MYISYNWLHELTGTRLTPNELRERLTMVGLAIDAIEDHVKLLGKQVILYGRGDVDLVDVSDPYRPKLVKVFHSFGRPPSNAAFARDTIVDGR